MELPLFYSKANILNTALRNPSYSTIYKLYLHPIFHFFLDKNFCSFVNVKQHFGS